MVQQASVEFRKAVFFEFGAVSPQMASLVAELVGFNPELVMPQLAAHLEQQQQRYQQQAAAAAAAAKPTPGQQQQQAEP